MKILVIALLMISSLLTGCVVAEPEYRDNARGDRGRMERDRDRDGVPDRNDRRPDDPRRY